MKQKTMLMIGGAIVVYLLWKNSQKTTDTVIVDGDEMLKIEGAIKGKGGVKYGASACQHPTNKVYTVCGQTCPNGHNKLAGAHMYGC